MSAPRPGDILLVVGESGSHFVIVVSEEEFNRGDRVLAVPVTSKRFEERAHLENCVAFAPGQFCFTTDCVAQAEAIMPVFLDSTDRQAGVVGRLDSRSLEGARDAIAYVLGVTIVPDV